MGKMKWNEPERESRLTGEADKVIHWLTDVVKSSDPWTAGLLTVGDLNVGARGFLPPPRTSELQRQTSEMPVHQVPNFRIKLLHTVCRTMVTPSASRIFTLCDGQRDSRLHQAPLHRVMNNVIRIYITHLSITSKKGGRRCLMSPPCLESRGCH